MTTGEPCIHELDPGTCSICDGRSDPKLTRATSGVRTDRFFSCPVRGRSLPETKFPTDRSGERRSERCRECRDYLVEERRRGVGEDEALLKRRRQFPDRPDVG